ncbi:MAG: hypothetical protein WAL30_00665 [Candidatus Aquirickettsiella sp.]
MRLKRLCTFLPLLILYATLSFDEPSNLTLEVYNPGSTSLFPVSSTLILGNKEAILVDAQFQKLAKKCALHLEIAFLN